MYAHSENASGQKHPLQQHLQEVARLAATFADKFQAGPWGYLAGLLHDVGKLQPLFQDYLAGRVAKGPDHSSAGAVLSTHRQYWEALAFLIAGHHGGLPDSVALKERLHKKGIDPTVLKACRDVENLLSFPGAPPLPSLNSPLQVELFLRMLFSALVDADFLDTENHFNPEKTVTRNKTFELQAMAELLRQDQTRFTGNTQSRMNKTRQEIYLACIKASALPPGIFRLTVPTGGGKTRSGLAFALEHAVAYNKHRIIVALPYTSIIDQTAQVFRDILGSDNVLEHHSAVMVSESEENFVQNQWAKLAAENWDAPHYSHHHHPALRKPFGP